MRFDIWYSPVRTDSHPSTVDAELIKNDEILNFSVDVKFWLRNYGNFATQIELRRSPWLAESYSRRLPAVAESSAVRPDCMHVLNQLSAWMTLDDQRWLNWTNQSMVTGQQRLILCVLNSRFYWIDARYFSS